MIAKRIWKQDPDELFNSSWIEFRERELRDPSWEPNDPIGYFITMMRNKALKWSKAKKKLPIEEEILPEEIEDVENIGERLAKWVETPSQNKDEEFLKNVIFLALKCKDINEACRVSEMSRASFWKYKRIAIEQFYECN